MATGKPPRNRREAIDGAVRTFRHISSHGFPFDEGWVREKAGNGWDRDPTSDGVTRQLAGIFASGDRTAELRQIDVPTLVIHGDRDRMVHPTGGAATARAVPGARLETIAGMGHDLPAGAWDRILDLITDHLDNSTVTTIRSQGAHEHISDTRHQRPHGGRHRCGVRCRSGAGATTFGPRLSGRDCRRRRTRFEGDRGEHQRSDAALTMTEPAEAAEIIHRGVEAGKARILIGPDARLFDALARLAPTRYYDLLTVFESRLRKRARAAAERVR
jgi:hypothetical protein